MGEIISLKHLNLIHSIWQIQGRKHISQIKGDVATLRRKILNDVSRIRRIESM